MKTQTIRAPPGGPEEANHGTFSASITVPSTFLPSNSVQFTACAAPRGAGRGTEGALAGMRDNWEMPPSTSIKGEATSEFKWFPRPAEPCSGSWALVGAVHVCACT